MTTAETLRHLLDDKNTAALIDRELAALGGLIISGEKPIILFGAGYMGRQALRALKNVGVRVAALIDDHPHLTDKLIETTPVLTAKEATRRFSSAVAFVTVLQDESSFVAITARLKAAGFSQVVRGSHLFAALLLIEPGKTETYFYIDLPSRVCAAREKILKAFHLLADEHSREEFLTQVRARLLLGYSGPRAEPLAEQYFTSGLFQNRSDEIFVDCGAFDGDTVRAFLKVRGAVFARIWALEPDPKNFEKLTASIAQQPVGVATRIQTLAVAVASTDGTVNFTPAGTAESGVTHSSGMGGTISVPCARLDTLLSKETPTLLKMDIEGAELGALSGASRTIGRAKPVVAACVYHRQADLWEIPLFLHSLFEGYRFTLRAYMAGRLETVCYAVPPSRAVMTY